MQHDSSDQPELPADFSVEDILRAPLRARDPEEALAAALRQSEDEVRSALWELDFAVQELEWLRRGAVREEQLVRSIVSQIVYSARNVERFPLDHLPLPEDLCEELSERFARLTEAIGDMPAESTGHDDIAAAHERLRAHLELRGVDVG